MNWSVRLITIVTAGLVGLAKCAGAAELHVSPVGHDANRGSAQSPLATLEGARRWIAAHRLAGKEPVTIWVHGGTYHLDRPFRLGSEDSGTAEAPITYRAVPGKEVLLKGSLPVNPGA